MNKTFSILFVLLLVSSMAYAQLTPTVDIIMTVADNGNGSNELRVGLDAAATTGIDPQFGESDLPPLPPLGAYDVRWNLQPFGAGALSTLRDYRFAASFPYTGVITHRLNWQYSDFATQLTITYNLPQNARMKITSNNATPVWQSDTLSGSGVFTLLDPDNDYNAARVYMIYDNIVPVELTSFAANVIGSTVKLNWSTATETNNRGFEIERKSENSNWQNIGFVSGAGTTTKQNNYSFTDKPAVGKYFYRLRQVDFDGTFEYSSVVEAEIAAPAEFKLNQNYPNPFNPSTTISFTLPKATNAKLLIYNQIGQKVAELVNKNLEAGIYNFNWDAAGQSSGLYFYELQTNEFKSVKKMTLIK